MIYFLGDNSILYFHHEALTLIPLFFHRSLAISQFWFLLLLLSCLPQHHADTSWFLFVLFCCVSFLFIKMCFTHRMWESQYRHVSVICLYAPSAPFSPFSSKLCSFIAGHMSSNEIILAKICISNSSWCASKPCSIRVPDERNQCRAELDWTHGEFLAVGA